MDLLEGDFSTCMKLLQVSSDMSKFFVEGF